MGRSAAFLDTNFIVRYLTGDPRDMAERAAQVIDSEEILVLSEIVLLETAYVLTKVYKVARPELVDALMTLVQKSNLQLANLSKPSVLESLRLCRDSKRHSFADALIWAQARERGAVRIYSFDGRFPSQGVPITGMK